MLKSMVHERKLYYGGQADPTQAWTELTEALPGLGRLCEVITEVGTVQKATIRMIDDKYVFCCPRRVKIEGVIKWRYLA